MAKFTKDDHFASFSKSLQGVILGYGSDDKDFTQKQKEQVEKLVELENKFKKVLLNDSRGHLVYRSFIKFILKEKRNILAARPYFRERQSSFSSGISPAIKNHKFKDLYKYSINYTFISFALDAVPWGQNSKIRKAAKEVYEIRKQIVETNLPLAISQARVFRHVTPQSHLTYMDMMQISFEGLINAVDKFVLPYTPVFRSVIIGRCKGDLIASYSDTMLHFYPSDKRKIYRANKAQKGQDREDINYDALAVNVNQSGPKLPTPTDAGEIQNLVMAASHFSLDSPVPENGGYEEGDTLSDHYADKEELRPDYKTESEEIHDKLSSCYRHLSVLELKLLKMKGIDLGGIYG